MDPGPSDSSVLHGQPSHRSSLVWEGQDVVLHCRRREMVMRRSIPLDRRILPLLMQSGFYGLARVRFIRLDWHLITALVERWHPETHTFHFPHGEATITLQDVAVQLGLPVDGLPVTGSTRVDWRQLCLELLGVVPPDDRLHGSRLSLVWLTEHFQDLAFDADEAAIQCYARAYILQLMGGCLFMDKSGNNMHLLFLPLLADFEMAGQYSWGSAGLAWLYREMCRASHRDVTDIAGPLLLLQLWAWDRVPILASHRLLRQAPDPMIDFDDDGAGLPQGPLGMR